jgi:hypothetical protein
MEPSTLAIEPWRLRWRPEGSVGISDRRSRIRIRIKLKSWVRIRINVLQIFFLCNKLNNDCPFLKCPYIEVLDPAVQHQPQQDRQGQPRQDHSGKQPCQLQLKIFRPNSNSNVQKVRQLDKAVQ